MAAGALDISQMQQFKAQVMAYRFLSRSQVPTGQILAAVQGKRYEPPPAARTPALQQNGIIFILLTLKIVFQM